MISTAYSPCGRNSRYPSHRNIWIYRRSFRKSTCTPVCTNGTRSPPGSTIQCFLPLIRSPRLHCTRSFPMGDSCCGPKAFALYSAVMTGLSWWNSFIHAGLATTAVFFALPAIGFGSAGIIRGSLIAWLQSVGAKGGFSMLWRAGMAAAAGGAGRWRQVKEYLQSKSR